MKVMTKLLLMPAFFILLACGKFSVSANAPVLTMDDTSSKGTVTPAPAIVTPINPVNVLEQGAITPTVYYTPFVDETKPSCQPSEKLSLVDTAGKAILAVCPKTSSICEMQGACVVQISNRSYHLNFASRINNKAQYSETPSPKCRFGYGVQEQCLDPFYTLAADLSLYHAGDVIFIPAAMGLQLPDGSLHSGFFIIRDEGRDIKGKGRFDFFSGFFSWQDPQNPFAKIQLTDQSTHLPYFKINGPFAEYARKSRQASQHLQDLDQ